jgi:hypothetical protein
MAPRQITDAVCSIINLAISVFSTPTNPRLGPANLDRHSLACIWALSTFVLSQLTVSPIAIHPYKPVMELQLMNFGFPAPHLAETGQSRLQLDRGRQHELENYIHERPRSLPNENWR